MKALINELFCCSLLFYKMGYSFILFCLLGWYCISSVVILQSSLSTTILSPTGATSVYSAYYNALYKGIAGPGVEWITSSKISYRTHYQNLFYANCIGNANLTITAAISFNAYLDGAYIGNGTNLSSVYHFPLKITCGNHNLTVVVYTTGDTKQGLTFAISQDQSNCFSCQVTGFWD